MGGEIRTSPYASVIDGPEYHNFVVALIQQRNIAKKLVTVLMKVTKRKMLQLFSTQALLNHVEHSPSDCSIIAEVLFVLEKCALLVNDFVMIAENKDTYAKVCRSS